MCVCPRFVIGFFSIHFFKSRDRSTGTEEQGSGKEEEKWLHRYSFSEYKTEQDKCGV